MVLTIMLTAISSTQDVSKDIYEIAGAIPKYRLSKAERISAILVRVQLLSEEPIERPFAALGQGPSLPGSRPIVAETPVPTRTVTIELFVLEEGKMSDIDALP